MTKASFTVAILLALTVPASAAQPTANEMMPGCKDFVDHSVRPTGFDMGYCAGLVYALVFTLDDVCWGGAITNEQMVRVVIKYIEARPERMQEGFVKLAAEALLTAWPCKR